MLEEQLDQTHLGLLSRRWDLQVLKNCCQGQWMSVYLWDLQVLKNCCLVTCAKMGHSESTKSILHRENIMGERKQKLAQSNNN